MNYKVGDKVRIKTWEHMAEELELWYEGENDEKIGTNCYFFTKETERKLSRRKNGRVVTISKVLGGGNYHMKGFGEIGWTSIVFVGETLIVSRFDLMDVE